METEPSWKVAATVTRQPLISGRGRLTLAFDASGPECFTVSVPAVTVKVTAVTARPFAIVRARQEISELRR